MDHKNIEIIIKIVVSISSIGMVAVNALVNVLPINGIGTGEVSDYYQNLFAPAGITFSIGGIIGGITMLRKKNINKGISI